MLFFSFFVAESFAADWKVSPQMTVTETYHDNIQLSQSNKNSELISQIQPSISLEGKGRRLSLNSYYQLSYIDYYSSQYSDRFSNQARMSADMEAIKKHLFITSSISVGQQEINPSSQQGFNPIAVTNNRTETRTFQISPRLLNRFGPFALSTLTYNYNLINHDSAQLESSWTDHWMYQLRSGKWFNQFTWTGFVRKQRSKESLSDNFTANARGDYKVGRKWGLFGVINIENYQFNSELNPNAKYYINSEAGFNWQPSRKIRFELGGGAVFNAPRFSYQSMQFEQWSWRAALNLKPTSRTDFELGKEQAVYGDRIFFHFDHRMRKFTVNSKYSETLSTPQQQRFDSLNSSSSTGALGLVDTGFAREITNDIVLRKRFDASATLKLKKLSFVGGGLLERGEYQTQIQTDKKVGVNASCNYTAGRRQTLSSKVSAERYYFNALQRVDSIYTLNMIYSITLSKKLSGSMTYQKQKRASSNDLSSYETNQIIATANWKF